MESSLESEILKPSLVVYLAVASAQMCGISLGCVLGWSSPVFLDMRRNNSEPHLEDTNEDNEVKSWIGSSATLGGLCGGLICGLCLELLGRKKTLILLGIPYSIGWITLCLSKKVWLIIVGRVITGICSGVAMGAIPTYVAEISTPKIRGLLGMAFNLSVTSGMLYIDVFSLVLDWNYLSLTALIPSILCSLSMLFMPESPNWLMTKYGRDSQVMETLNRLRSPESDLDKELDELQKRAELKKLEPGFSLRQLKRQDVYKPFLIGIVLMFFQQFSGINAVMFYSTDIFKESGSELEPAYATLVLNITMIFASIFGGIIVDRFGRKVLLFSSGFGHMSSLAVMGYHYYRNRPKDNGIIMTTITTMTANPIISTTETITAITTESTNQETSILPILCLVVFVISFSIGYGPVPWIIVTEITSSSAIGFVASTSSVFAWIFTFAVTKEFPDMQNAFNNYGAVWFFSGISFLSIVFAYFLIETKGKSIEEIQTILYPKVMPQQNGNKHIITM